MRSELIERANRLTGKSEKLRDAGRLLRDLKELVRDLLAEIERTPSREEFKQALGAMFDLGAEYATEQAVAPHEPRLFMNRKGATAEAMRRLFPEEPKA